MAPPLLLVLPRELRDEIISHLMLPGFVYTSTSKQNTENLHRGQVPAPTFVDTRIYLPSRVAPSALGVCRQLREECLQYHAAQLNSATSARPKHNPAIEPMNSRMLAERLGNENDDETERYGDSCMRVTLEVLRAQRNTTGYAQPVREEPSPRLLALLPLMNRTKKVRFVVWPGYDWWNGSRPRAMRRVHGRLKLVEDEPAKEESVKADAVTFAVTMMLKHLPAIEELQIDIISYIGEFRRGDLPDKKWENIQYWLDAPVSRAAGHNLRTVTRKLSAVWYSAHIEHFYQQRELRKEENRSWSVTRRGDMLTVSSALHPFSHC